MLALATACAVTVVTGCGSSTDDAASGDSVTASVVESSTTPPPSTDSSDSVPSGDTIGSLRIVISASSEDDVAEENLDAATSVLRDQLSSIPNDASITVTGDSIEVIVEDVAAQDQDAIVELVRPISRVSLRGVLQCAAVPSGSEVSVSSATTPTPTDPTQSGFLYTRPGPDRELCQVGPVAGTAAVFSDATAQILGGSWGVLASLRSDESGEGVWNNLAASCYEATEECPTRRLAIVLDDEIVSAPTVNAPSFTGSVQITGNFGKAEADGLADVINAGATDQLFVIDSVTFTPT